MDIPCPQCGSTNYEEEDGLQVCENGHYIEGAQQVVDTEQEFGAPRGKVTTRKVEKIKVKITKGRSRCNSVCTLILTYHSL